MRKIAILVIAATNKPIYEYYIRNYWTDLIRHTRSMTAHIDVFLLFEKKFDSSGFENLEDNIIRDDETDLTCLCDRRFFNTQVPGIISKTIFALELLQDHYDVFFRTNLSSVLRLSRFDNHVQTKDVIRYSGAFVWEDALRDDLLNNGQIGPGKSIETLEELSGYPGNTFISGSGYFLNKREAQLIVQSKDRIRYAIPDDVAVGLMLPEHELLRGFTQIIKADTPEDVMDKIITNSAGCQIRLQHLPLGMAQKFWDQFKETGLWQ